MKALTANLKEFFGSKKTKASIKGCLVVLLTQYLGMPTEVAMSVAAIVMVHINGIAKQDVAKLNNKQE